jgi:hypothetical protein
MEFNLPAHPTVIGKTGFIMEISITYTSAKLPTND